MNQSILTDLVITNVYSAFILYSPENKKSKRINRPCWAIAIKYEGETYYHTDGKSILSDAAHLVILPKGCSYEWECTKAGRCAMIEFECAETGAAPIPVPVSNVEKILKLFKKLEYQRTLKTETVRIESIRDTYSILLAMLQGEGDHYLPADKKQKIDLALEYISQNYTKKITNEELASLTGLSTVYFRKLFTYTVGTSPISYAQNLRIEKAKELLKSDYGSLSDVAMTLGYSSLYDFSRAFKKHTGTSPSKYGK